MLLAQESPRWNHRPALRFCFGLTRAPKRCGRDLVRHLAEIEFCRALCAGKAHIDVESVSRYGEQIEYCGRLII